MVKRILSVVFGLVAGVVTISLVESFGHILFPLGSVDMSSPEAIKQFIQNIPTGAIAMVLVGWVIGAFVGGIIASLIDIENSFRNSVVIGVVILILSIINLIMLPSPIWMWIGAIALIVPFAIVGNKLVVMIKK